MTIIAAPHIKHPSNKIASRPEVTWQNTNAQGKGGLVNLKFLGCASIVKKYVSLVFNITGT